MGYESLIIEHLVTSSHSWEVPYVNLHITLHLHEAVRRIQYHYANNAVGCQIICNSHNNADFVGRAHF